MHPVKNNTPQVYPEDIQCVLLPNEQQRGGIFISNIEAAQNPSTLKKNKIGAVVTAIKGKNLSDVIPRQLQYLYVPAIDAEGFNIKQFFKITNQFLKEQLARTNVLVHCIAGVSRSVTLVIAYLMWQRGLSCKTAFQMVKKRRPIICPNDSFIEQLQQYQQQLKSKNPIQTNKENINKKEPKPTYKQKANKQKLSKVFNSYYQRVSYDVALKQNISRVFKKRKVDQTPQNNFNRIIFGEMVN